MTYSLLDSGNQRKLEQFGPYILDRPCAQALWRPQLSEKQWKMADAVFTREKGNEWIFYKQLPSNWTFSWKDISFKIAPTDFGHLGIFPEHSLLWEWMQQNLKNSSSQPSVLNLFAYSGAATLAAAKAGAKVCHVDASKGMVAWARENAALNHLESAPVRWIVDDVKKFLQREIRRGVRYDGILMDPPSFGRGRQGEIFKIEEDLWPLLESCRDLLSDSARFFIFSSHTAGMSPIVMQQILSQVLHNKKGHIESGELVIPSHEGMALPSGSYARWYL
jgi:23S rRNA (cytosine1962-C5)-methyltransferase